MDKQVTSLTQVNNTLNIFIGGKPVSLDHLAEMDRAFPELKLGARYLQDPLVESEHRRSEETAQREFAIERFRAAKWKDTRAQGVIGLAIFAGLGAVIYLGLQGHDWLAAGLLGSLALVFFRAKIFHPKTEETLPISVKPMARKKKGP